MIIRFQVSNFRSLRERQELSMVAARSAGSGQGVAHDAGSGLDLLHVAAIYGANAAGKSNVLQALQFMKTAVVQSQWGWKPDEGIPRDPFLLAAAGEAEPSSWELEFILDGIRHQYGFTLDSAQVLEEWLFVFPQGRKQVWFRRDARAETPFTFGKHLRGNNRATASLTRSNGLFVSAAAANNHPMLSSVYSWFTQSLTFSGLEPLLFRVNVAVANLEGREGAVLGLLRQADLGIGDIETAQQSLTLQQEEFFDFVLKEQSEKIKAEILRQAKSSRILKLRHSPAGIALPLAQESRGTQAWLSLVMPVLLVLETGGILCVDELDASLHPHLALACIGLFEDPARNPKNAQLIFNTHDTTLLGNLSGRQGLQRDQVWFVEKDAAGATHLYPLTDFKPRKDENLERGYLQGRYGAIPFIAAAGVVETGDG